VSRSPAAPANVKDPAVLGHIVLDFKQMNEFVHKPLIMERADGVRYWDVDGKSYLDGLSGIFVVNIGHNNRRVIEAMKAQLDKIAFAPPLHGTNTPAVKLAAKIAEITPGDLNTVKLLNSGSEATEAAMKLARQYHQQTGNASKFKVISRYFGYHGATMGALGATGTTKRRWMFEPFAPSFVKVQTAHCYRCPYALSYPQCNVLCARIVRDVIRMEGPQTVSAFIVEPIGNTGGIITPPPEYFPILREICNEFDVLLIFDEVLTGFGRTGNMFAAQTFGVTPDILCMGKGITSGYAPMSAIAFSDKVKSAFWGAPEAGIEFAHGHTYGGNPLSAAAALAVIDVMLEDDLPGRARETGAYLRRRLEGLARFGIVGEVRGKGMLLGVELVKNPATKEAWPVETRIGLKIGEECMARGLIIRFDPDWIALAPPLIMTRDEVDELMSILEASIQAVLQRIA
jgi:adenosylmethionine-8-amino-7-oxononanoate aminotransferase